MKKITIALIEDHKLLRQAWKNIVEQNNRFEVVGESGNSIQALEMCSHKKPQVVLMDINIAPYPGNVLARQIKHQWPFIRIIAFTIHSGREMVDVMIKEGCSGYVTKCSSSLELFKAIEMAVDDQQYLCSAVTVNLQ